MEKFEPSTPTKTRALTSYPARRTYAPGVVFPPAVPNVQKVIDVHCHAHNGQQDAVALAKLASENGMGGLLFKTIGEFANPNGPVGDLERVRRELDAWSRERHIQPTQLWAGWGITRDNRAPTPEKMRANLRPGIVGVWLPVANHANTYFKVGGKPIWWDSKANPKDHTLPLPWDEAVKVGFYMLDEHHRLKPEYSEAIRMVADFGCALFFGHATHQEIFAVAELVNKLGIKRAVIDHPFSPFVDLSVAQMKELAQLGIFLNFTFDEISPLLGVDPKVMYEVIRAVGTKHCVLSSDAGEPLFPNSVECMRLLRGYMEAFGMSSSELDDLCVHNPEIIVGARTA